MSDADEFEASITERPSSKPTSTNLGQSCFPSSVDISETPLVDDMATASSLSTAQQARRSSHVDPALMSSRNGETASRLGTSHSGLGVSQDWQGNPGSNPYFPGQFQWPTPFPYFNPYFHGMQPMSGMAGVGFAPFSQGHPPMPVSVGHNVQEGIKSSQQRESAVSSKRNLHSPQRLSSSTSRKKRTRSPSPFRRSLSPSSRRSFVRRARNLLPSDSSSSRSSGSEEEDDGEFQEERNLDFSFSAGIALVADIRPDLVTSSDKERDRVISAGERVFSRRKSTEEPRALKQADLVTETLAKLQLDLRGQQEPPAPGEPAELPHRALKTGELLPPTHSLAKGGKSKRSLLGKGSLPDSRLVPSRSDLSSRSSSKVTFKPFLKEKGLNHLEDTARRGLEALSISDTLLGVVMDSLDSESLSDSYTRQPSKDELLQLMLLACKSVAQATDSVARCYLDAILIRRDSFLSSADRLPEEYDRSALRSLPIASPTLIGPQVALNVEKFEKKQFDTSVRSIVSKSGGKKASPRKRSLHSDFHTPAKFKRRDGSSSRPSSFFKKNTGRGNHHSSRGKSQPKGSAHPQ